MEQDSKAEIHQSNGGEEAKVASADTMPATNGEKESNSNAEATVVIKIQKAEVTHEQEAKEGTEGTEETEEVEEVEEIEEVEESSSESEQEIVTTEKEQNSKIEQNNRENAENECDKKQEEPKTEEKEEKDVQEEEEEEEEVIVKDTTKIVKQAGAASEEKAVREKEEIPKQKSEVEASDSIDSKQGTDTQKAVEVHEQVADTQGSKQETVNNTIKEIISDIDSNIREQERVALLKQEELKLLKKQQELAQQIEQQQLLARKLATQNDIMQQKYQQQQQQLLQQQELQEQQQQQQQQIYQHQQQQNQLQRQDVQNFQRPNVTSSKYSSHEESRDGNTVTQRTESYETQESSNVTKRIDLQKIFTPATDAEEILPKNRKLYASSAFYSPTLHPTVEDQVELARRISHSLSDISNQQSKGQSMYVNRKKRSVKWVHEGQAGETTHEEFCDDHQKENADIHTVYESDMKRTSLDKVPLRLLMNPRGQVRDYNSLRDSLNIESGLLSPEKCAELVTALQTHKGRGAELFAKRRKKADNWVVDETTASTHSPSGLPDNHPYQAPSPKPPTSPSILPAYSDAGKHRVQLNIHQEQVLEKYAKPGLKVVKSPWEAALESGSASTAFIEESKSQQHRFTPTPSPALQETSYQSTPLAGQQLGETQQYPAYKPSSYNDQQRDLAYKPNIPQGWKAPSVSLPKDQGQTLINETNKTSNDTQIQLESCQVENLLLPFCETSQDDTFDIISNLSPLKVVKDNSVSTNFREPPTNIEKTPEQPYKRVDVRRQLEHFEKQQIELAKLRKYEESLQQKRGRNQRSWKWQERQNSSKTQLMEKSNEPESSSAEKPNGEEYVKVAVRDLIESFEQQVISEEQSVFKATHFVPIQAAATNCEDQKLSDLEDEELYVPKEIPLESYAPPPVINIKPTPSYSPYGQHQSQQQHTWAPTTSPLLNASPYDYSAQSNTEYYGIVAPGSSFPVNSKPNIKHDYSTAQTNFPVSANQPPKQQYWEPTSYQKVSPAVGAQKLPQVNFNPSPLPYEKLAKFEATDNDDTYRQYASPQSQRYLTPTLSSKVRNTSPAPFGTKNFNQNLHQPQSFPYQRQFSPSSFSTSNHFSPKELLHAPTYNSSAQGWHATGGRSNPPFTKHHMPLTSIGDIPYSDF